jgi:glycosyltransferase involved in cell wall biosynthesis
MKKSTTVSLVTVTQLNRHKCLLILYDLIKMQTYKNIIEWIIIEGSNNIEDANKNKIYIKEIIKLNSTNSSSTSFTNSTSSMKIIYIEFIDYNKNTECSKNKLSDLRNIGNDTSKGDIIVCMDDDDYYPPERVSQAVIMLTHSKKLIAGCSSMYMYDYYLKQFFKFDKFDDNHSTNNCMAYKREYLLNHRHQSGLTSGEEASFTNNFTEPMIQLNSKNCIICSSHDSNTFNKLNMCISALQNENSNTSLKKINKNILAYMPIDIWNRMFSNFCVINNASI